MWILDLKNWSCESTREGTPPDQAKPGREVSARAASGCEDMRMSSGHSQCEQVSLQQTGERMYHMSPDMSIVTFLNIHHYLSV